MHRKFQLRIGHHRIFQKKAPAPWERQPGQTDQGISQKQQILINPNFPANARERLSNRRGHELLDFEHCGFRYTTGFGRFPDGKPAEIFLNISKTGTMLEALAKDAAVIASIALQYGAPVETLRHALMRDSLGNASSPVGRALDILCGSEP